MVAHSEAFGTDSDHRRTGEADRLDPAAESLLEQAAFRWRHQEWWGSRDELRMHLYLEIEIGGFGIDQHENVEHGFCLSDKTPHGS